MHIQIVDAHKVTDKPNEGEVVYVWIKNEGLRRAEYHAKGFWEAHYAKFKEEDIVFWSRELVLDIKTTPVEKFWQIKAGRMASIANFFYQYVNESKVGDDDLDIIHEMVPEMLEILPFDEEIV